MRIPRTIWQQKNKGDRSGNLWATWNIDIGDTIKSAPRHSYIMDENEAGVDLGLVTAFLRMDTDGTDRYWALNNQGRLLKTSGLTPTISSFWETEADGTLNYDAQTADFTVGDTLTGGTSGATATIVTDDDSGTAGTLGLISISGTFQNDETITDASGGSATSDGTVTDTNAPTACKDMVNFRGDLIVAEQNDLSKNSSGTWDSSFWQTTLSQSAFSTSTPVLHVADFLNIWLLLGDGNVVHVITNNNEVLGSGSGRIVLPEEYTIEWIRSTSNRYWIGTSHNTDAEARVFEWDGKAEVPNNSYGVNSERILSCVVKDDVPYVLNNKGQLLYFKRNSFKEAARLPITNEPLFQFNSSLNISKPKRLGDDAVRQRGMALIEDRIHILTSGETNLGSARSMINFPAGVWVFDTTHGLYHRHGIGQTQLVDTLYDYGAQTLDSVGGILSLGGNDDGFLYGVKSYTDSQSTTLFSVGSLAISSDRRGYFITPRILSSDIKQNFNQLTAVFNRLRKSGEEIVVKYRTEIDPVYPIQDSPGVTEITWSDTDTFTTGNSAYSDVKKGDEVEILNGKGSGTTAHISSITESGGTYTVNLDETFSNVTGTAQARVMNWKKIGKVTETGLQSKTFGLDGTAEWVQFKIELRSVNLSYDSPEIDKLELTSATGQTT